MLSANTDFIISLTKPYTYCCLPILTLSYHSQTHINIAVCQYSLYHLTHTPIKILLSVNIHFITSLTKTYKYCCLSIFILSLHSHTHIHIAVCQYSLYQLTHTPIYILLSVNSNFITSLTNPYTYCCLSILTLLPYSHTHINIAVYQYSLNHLTHTPIYIFLCVNTHFITSLTLQSTYCCLSILTLSPHSQTHIHIAVCQYNFITSLTLPYTYCCLSILTLSPHSHSHIHIAVSQYSLYHPTHTPMYTFLFVNTHFIISLKLPYTYCCLLLLTLSP